MQPAVQHPLNMPASGSMRTPNALPRSLELLLLEPLGGHAGLLLAPLAGLHKVDAPLRGGMAAARLGCRLGGACKPAAWPKHLSSERQATNTLWCIKPQCRLACAASMYRSSRSLRVSCRHALSTLPLGTSTAMPLVAHRACCKDEAAAAATCREEGWQRRQCLAATAAAAAVLYWRWQASIAALAVL